MLIKHNQQHSESTATTTQNARNREILKLENCCLCKLLLDYFK